MYVTTVILKEVCRGGDASVDQYPQPYRMVHPSMTHLKDWVRFHNMILGNPEVNTNKFSVERLDGSSLSKEELARLGKA